MENSCTARCVNAKIGSLVTRAMTLLRNGMNGTTRIGPLVVMGFAAQGIGPCDDAGLLAQDAAAQ